MRWIPLNSRKAAASDSTGETYAMHSEPDTGEPISVGGDNCWVINPQSSFPLTIYPTNRKVAHDIKTLLDHGDERLRVIESLQSLMLKEGIRCKEVDDYVARFKSTYVTVLDKLKRESTDWSNASESDRPGLLRELRAQAAEMLDVSPAAICDVPTLFECEPDSEKVRKLFSAFGLDSVELCRLHGRYDRSARKVYHLGADDRYKRPDFERLFDRGLATRGFDIPIVDILNSITLKDLRTVLGDTNQPSFKRKAEAVEYAAKLADITVRLAKILAFQELFQLRPLPEYLSALASELRSEAAVHTQRFVHESSSLIAHTYVMGAYDFRDRSDSEVGKIATGWKIRATNGSCPMCRRTGAKIFPKGTRPRVPLHIGCRCNVEAEFG